MVSTKARQKIAWATVKQLSHWPSACKRTQQRAKGLAMENSHRKCVAAVQRPLELFEVSELVQSTRAKLVLPEQTA
jgi:hypothetical protein